MSLAVSGNSPVRDVQPESARNALLSPRLDPWVLGWIAVVAWIALVVTDRSGNRFPSGSWLIWTAAAIGAVHFAMSYRLAYHDGAASMRRHPIALVVGPAVLLLFVAGGVVGALSGSVTASEILGSSVALVFLLTMWHYIKQVYGVVRLAAGFAGFALTPGEGKAIRYGLYPLWGLSVASYATGRNIVDVNGFTVRTDLIPDLPVAFRAAAVALTAMWLTVVLARAAQRQHRLPPSAVVAPMVAAMLWVGWIPNVYAALIMLPAFHALQYMACVYPAQRGLLGFSTPTSRRNQFELAQIFVAATCIGLFLTRYAAPLLERFAPVAVDPSTWLIALFVFLNLHHYLIDATVWRSGGELVRAVQGRR